MVELLDYVKEFIAPELLILIPVLYAIGAGIKASKISDRFIPFILGACGVLLAAAYLVAETLPSDFRGVATLVFAAITQGVLCAAASVYVNQLIKQAKKPE